jgi:hypothetical protein
LCGIGAQNQKRKSILLPLDPSSVGVDGPTASRARIGAVSNQNRSRP